ncbi:hypothetical protein ACFONL_07040 [Camelimonas fluminis]|uniref:Uncharacterized protein n=2 Tax=Camelimonas fluminis TaxID=1576911 RepID=A0ABV7UGC6_9HYPH
MHFSDFQQADDKIANYRTRANAVAIPTSISIPPPFARATTSPSPAAATIYNRHRSHKFLKTFLMGASSVGLAGSTALFFADAIPMALSVCLASTAGAGSVRLLPKPNAGEIAEKYRQAVEAVNSQIHTLQERVPVDALIAAKQNTLLAIDDMEARLQQARLALAPYAEARRERQIAYYMSLQTIVANKIPALTQRDVDSLSAAGRHSAGDILNPPAGACDLQAIKGIGKAKQENLKSWADAQVAAFTGGPNLTTDEEAEARETISKELAAVELAADHVGRLMTDLLDAADRIDTLPEQNDEGLRQATRALAQARFDMDYLRLTSPHCPSPEPRSVYVAPTSPARQNA